MMLRFKFSKVILLIIYLQYRHFIQVVNGINMIFNRR
ncbi:Uncharacterised protein [Serratia fonticola]|nr:Uncharacterised protein [Serratia fonticola]